MLSILFLYQFDEFYSCSHFFSNLVIAPTSFSMGSLRAPKKWKSEGVRFRPFGGWGRTDSPSFLLDCFLFFQTCARLCVFLLKGDFRNIFVRFSSPETLPHGFKGLNLQI